MSHGQPKRTEATQEISRQKKKKTKKYEKSQKQINETVDALSKHQTESETTINRDK
jgi:hypothetical protein